MMIPLTTDAPIYHLPITTIGLILVNVACFCATGYGIDDVNHPWILHFGTINPLEWLSNIFAHGDWLHLIGNMIFLWSFGLIVEGKLGWKRMLTVYLLIGITESAIIQLVMFFPGGTGAMGASSAIMGLMALCLIWAPKNEFSVLLFIVIYPIFFDVTIMFYALWYLFWEVAGWALSGFSMSSAALHLSGALIGLSVGTLYVRKGWVDCENWDLFAVMNGTYGPYGDPSTTVGSHADPGLLFGKDVDVTNIKVAQSTEKAKRRTRRDERIDLDNIRKLIDAGHAMDASEALQRLRMTTDNAHLTETYQKRMARGLFQANAVDEAEVALDEYIERFPESATWARLKIARILLVERAQPAAALGQLKQVRLSQLSAEQQLLAKKVAREARRQVNAGVVDAEDEW